MYQDVLLGCLCFNDTVRDEAKACIQELKACGAEKIVVLTGDRQESANQVCQDMGIAIGAMGSDLPIQSSDIALMNNNLENIPFAVKLAYQTKSTIYSNLLLSTSISVVMIVLSAIGVISVFVGSIM